MSLAQVIRPEHLQRSTKHTSPCGRFELEVESYQVLEPRGWPYSRLIVRRGTQEVCSIDRNFSFRGGFFQRGGETWFWTGRHYQSQVFVNCETGAHCEYQGAPITGSTFCWAGAEPSRSGALLAVDGCVWAAPYELRFFDLSAPEHGWPELPLRGVDEPLETEQAEWEWQGDTFYYREYSLWNTHLDKAQNELTGDEHIEWCKRDSDADLIEVDERKLWLERRDDCMVAIKQWTRPE